MRWTRTVGAVWVRASRYSKAGQCHEINQVLRLVCQPTFSIQDEPEDDP